MKVLGKFIEERRLAKGMVIRELAALAQIDAALISKFEKGHRLPTEENLIALSTALEIPYAELRKIWLAEKVYDIVRYEINASEILSLAESRTEYLSGASVFDLEPLSDTVVEKLKTLDDLKIQWKKAKPLNKTQLRKMKEYFHVGYTFESNRIEGNTLSLQETHLVVNEGLTIGGKSMREHLEAINHSEAIDFVEELALRGEPLTKRSLLEIHYLILKGIDRENAGVYRAVPVRISGSKHEPPQPYLIEKMMEDYFVHYQLQRSKMHPVILAAEMHERLVSIHPFIDGNGRTSRLVMNLILLKNGYTIANLKGDYDSRMKYYRALESVQVNNNPEDFYLLVIDACIESLKEHLALAA